MSKNMCQVCSLITELCGCSLNEPRLESESVLMVVENQPHPSVFLDHLCELKLEEGEKSEFLHIPKLSRQTNLVYLGDDEALICDHELLAISEPKIPQVYELEDGEIYESNETKNKEAAANFIAKYNI
jgi:hypothetical protein